MSTVADFLGVYPPRKAANGGLLGVPVLCACSKNARCSFSPLNLTSIQDTVKEIVQLNFSLMCNLTGLWFCGLGGSGA